MTIFLPGFFLLVLASYLSRLYFDCHINYVRKTDETNTYLDMDRSSPRIRLVQPSLHQREPLQYFVEYELSVIFVNLQTN